MRKRQILAVEDDGVIALDIAAKLHDLGYGVAAVTATGEEAIEKAEGKRPDLVLMDIHLSGTMSGTEAADVIQKRFDIPVVYLTAHCDPSKSTSGN